jgi:uncharacterized protein YgiM (DUF1202 family)
LLNYKLLPAMVAFLMLLAGIPCQAGTSTGSVYQVAAESALLRDYPSPNSGILANLNRLDQVEYIDSNAQGWWKVRSLRTGVTGWMTSDLLTAVRPTPSSASAKIKYFYVNRPSIELRVIPLESSAATGTVQLNDKLEKISEAPNGWTKVRNPRKGNKGWIATRYLSSQIVTAPQAPVSRKRVKKAYNIKKKKSLEPPKETVEEQAKPM